MCSRCSAVLDEISAEDKAFFAKYSKEPFSEESYKRAGLISAELREMIDEKVSNL